MAEQIPEEIWKIAFLAGSWRGGDKRTEAIARALMARDKRAAEIARSYPERDPAEDGNGYWAAEEIATAILTYDGSPAKEKKRSETWGQWERRQQEAERGQK